MFRPLALTTGLCLAVVSLNAVAEARTVTNGITLNGITLNGTSFNGMSFNGTSFNGVSMNGVSINGTNLNGTSFNGTSFNGLAMNGTRSAQSTGTTAALDGVPVQQIRLEGSQLMFHLQRSTR